MFQNVKQKTARKIPNFQKSSKYSNKLKHCSKKPQYPKIASDKLYTKTQKIPNLLWKIAKMTGNDLKFFKLLIKKSKKFQIFKNVPTIQIISKKILDC